MPTAKLIDKNNKEVESIDFKATGRPLPHLIERGTTKYSFERRDNSTYYYKQES